MSPMRSVAIIAVLVIASASSVLAYEGVATVYGYRGESSSSQFYSRFAQPSVYQDPYRPVGRPVVREAGPAALPLGHHEYNDYDDHYDEYLAVDDWRWGREYYRADQRLEFDPYYYHHAHYVQRYGWSQAPSPEYETSKRTARISGPRGGFAAVAAEAEEIVEESLDDVELPDADGDGFLGGDVDGPWN